MLDLTMDGHVHTRLCRHAIGSMDEYVRMAEVRGIKRLFFLEHLEKGIDYFERTWLTESDFDEYFRLGKELQQTWKGRIEIGLGVEVGYNPERRHEILAALAARPWDRIGISYHFMKVEGHHYNLVSRKKDNLEALGRLGVTRVLSEYFATLLEAIETLPGQIVCHLDAAMRYHPEIRLEENHYRQIDEIFTAMSSRRLALEVNASGCRMRGEPFPTRELIAEALRRGIALAAGSDAHRPQDVGQFTDLRAFMVENGFPVFTGE
jgi:histidinol-phosphatase (PHP family)